MSDAWNENVIEEALKSGAETRFLGASIVVSHTCDTKVMATTSLPMKQSRAGGWSHS